MLQKHSTIILIVATAIVTAAIVSGAGFAFLTYKELKNSNEMLRSEIESVRSEKIATTSSPTATTTEIREAAVEEAEPDETVEEVTETYSQAAYQSYYQNSYTDTTPEPAMDTSTESEEVEIEISNVTTETIGDFTDITWETNVDTTSRIIIDDDFYVSNSGNAKNHSVNFTGLADSNAYNYEIVATNGSDDASYFGKFYTPLEYEVRIASSIDDGCYVVVLEDGGGTPIPGVPLKIQGKSDSYTRAPVYDTTTIHGEVEVCQKGVEEVVVTDTETGDVLYDSYIFVSYY